MPTAVLPGSHSPDAGPALATPASPVLQDGPLLFNFKLSLNSSTSYEFVSINPGTFTLLFPQADLESVTSTPFYLSIKLLGSRLFNNYKVYQLNINPAVPPHTILLNSIHLQSKYASNLTIDKCLVCPITHDQLCKIPLSQCIIALPAEVYNLLKNFPNRSKKLNELIIWEKGNNLIKKSDFLNSLNALVLHCEPLDQGLIDQKTVFTLVENDDIISKTIDSNKNFSNLSLTPSSSEPSSIDYFESFGHDHSGDLISNDTFSSFSMKTASLTPDMLAVYSKTFTSSNKQIHNQEDDQIFALLSNVDLQRLNCFNGDLINLKTTQVLKCDCCTKGLLCACDKKDPIELNYPIRVFPLIDPNEYLGNTIYLSPLFLNSIGKPSEVELSKYPKTSDSIMGNQQKVADIIPVAKEITISRIVSPVTLSKTNQHLFLSNLKNFFEVKNRLININQFIPIPIDTELSKSLFAIYDSSSNTTTTNGTTTNSNGNINSGNSTTNGYLANGSGAQPLENDPASSSAGGVLQYPEVIPQGIPNELAWFKITDGLFEDPRTGNEYKLIDNQKYIIDSSKTRMIQAGISNDLLSEFDNFQILNYFKIASVFQYPKHDDKGREIFKYAGQLRKIFKTVFKKGTNKKINSKLNLQTSILLCSLTRNTGKSTLIKSISTEYGINYIEFDGYELLNPSSESKTIGLIRGKLDKLVEQCTNGLVIYFKHIESLAKKQDPQQVQGNQLVIKFLSLLQEYYSMNSKLIVCFSSNSVDDVSELLRSKVKFEIELNIPDESERREIFKYLIKHELNSDASGTSSNGNSNAYEHGNFCVGGESSDEIKYSTTDDLSIDHLSLQSAGLTPKDIKSIVRGAKFSALDRFEDLAEESQLTLHQLIIQNGNYIKLSPLDFEKSINLARNKFSDSIGAPRIPDVKWEDVGGLDTIKGEILDTIDMPLKHPELFNNGIKKRSGILFYGPPGTGKTLLAKAIATNFALNFFSVKGPELLNMYIGESEANVRKVFQRARDAKPCVVFFDELDSVAPKRGNQGDSGGVMDRIVSQLLAELDGMSSSSGDGDGVFVVGATNRPDLLDEALLRPGRFDKMLYLGISDTTEKQLKIIEALSRKFQLHEDVDLGRIASLCPFNFTGADFYALCSDAMLNAMTRVAQSVDVKLDEFNAGRKEEGKEEVSSRYWFDNVATKSDIEVLVMMQDYEKAQRELIPSVSYDELQHYLKIKHNFEGDSKDKPKVEPVDEEILNGYENGQVEVLNGNGHGNANGNGDSNGHHIYQDDSNDMNGHAGDEY